MLRHPFWWDSNAWFGMVETRSDLDSLLEYEPNAMDGQECDFVVEGPPKFGFRAECRGQRTLKQYLETP